MIDTCPQCALTYQNDLLQKKREAERIALGGCWVDGGIVNNNDKPTVIRIDCPISKEHKAEIMDLLKKIENSKEGQD